MKRTRRIAVIFSALLAAVGFGPMAVGAQASAAPPGPVPTAQLATLPSIPGIRTTTKDANTACTLPDGGFINFFHCYTPAQIRSAYGVDDIAPLGGQPNYGQGQTIVLVDSYGSPTAAADLQTFHDQFFPQLPDPDFTQVFPLGNPQYGNVAKGKGQSGPAAAAGWAEEATLDIEWSYAIAPEAHIVLLAVPPAETVGVQGFPNLFKAISGEIDATPPGTVFSLSFSAAEQNFGGAAATQAAKFDQVFKKGLARDDNFFVATGDTGTVNTAKQHHRTSSFSTPTVNWPATSPYVVAVGGTQLQDGWTWNPTSNDAVTASGALNPAYWQSTSGGHSQAVWNESWGPDGSGGGASTIYARPAWQQNVDPAAGNHRLVPDTAWNAAVNGGVDIYISAYPTTSCGTPSGCWTLIGGTSAATPQTAALVALVNAARAAAHKAPIGFLDPLLYGGVGSADYTDVTPQHYGSAPKVFAGSEVGVGTVEKSVGDLVDNQMWGSSVPGYPTTSGYDMTTGWGTPSAPSFVSTLTAMP